MTFLVTGEIYQSKMQQVRGIQIKKVHCLGRYIPMGSIPVAIKFYSDNKYG